MDVEWDENKNRANVAKHGLDFKFAKLILTGPTVSYLDERKNYGENRWIVYGLLNSRLICVVYTGRNNNIRIISMRKANRREIDKYEKNLQKATPPPFIIKLSWGK